MLLRELFDINSDINIKKLTTDSRDVIKGALFFCIEGFSVDRHDYIDAAIDKGAVAIVHSKDVTKKDNIEYIKVENVYHELERVSDIYYQYPSKHLNVYGVTGTNGKSTITSTLRHVLNRLGSDTGYVGTISIEYQDVMKEPTLTTPDVVEMHEILSEMVDHGVKNVALEISSQGLDLKRVDTLDFDTVVFTNLSLEHLDYHPDMESYYLAKKHLFDLLKPEGTMVINIDDPYGKRLYDAGYTQNKVSVAIDQEADYRAIDLKLSETESRFTLVHEGVLYPITTNMLAQFNVYNLLEVIASVHQNGYPLPAIIDTLKDLPIVKGRVNMIDKGQKFRAIVDYSHTPDGFEKIYRYLRDLTKGRLIAVYGNAGGRDKTKRPIMGQISDQFCDLIVITEQDRRTEDILQIKAEMTEFIKNTPYVFIEKRYEAIQYALEIAKDDDTVVVLGKGDERFQHGPTGKEDWMGDDNAVKEILSKMMNGGFV